MPDVSKHANDQWWDTWMIVYNNFAHAEYDSETEANDELERIIREFPSAQAYIVHTENAGYGVMRYKMLAVMGFMPLGRYG